MSRDVPLPSRRASQRPKADKPPGKGFRWGRFVFVLLTLIIIALGSYAGYLYFIANENLDKVAAPEDGIVVPEEERAQVKPVSLVLLGLDHRLQTGSMNTDVMMVAVFNPKTKTATVVSIPRDTDLKLDGYKKHKANAYYAAFYSYGKNQEKLEGDKITAYARVQTREMLEKFFGVSLDYTAVIDFQGFIDVVDALDGVRVNVDQNMRYTDSADGTDINLEKGEQTLNGKKALDFVRYRKSNHGTAASSDFARNERQSQVLGAITDKLKAFSTFTKVHGVLNAVGDNLRTDIPRAQIENIIKTYFGINRSDIRFIPLEGTWKSPYVYLDEGKLAEAKRALAEELQPDGRPGAVSASSAVE